MDTWRGGIVRRRELLSAGIGRRGIDRLLSTGELVRVRGGWYARAGLDSDRMAAARAGARVGCISAARLHGMWTPSADPTLHLIAHAHSAVSAPGHVLHFAASEPPVTRCRNRLLAEPAAALASVAICQPVPIAFVVAESALERRLVLRREWRGILEGLPARRRVQLSSVTDLSGSGTESEFVRRLRRLGIPFRQQVWIGRDRVDVELDDGTVVELDSRGHHDPVQDARRDARTSALGHDTLRFFYDQVWFDWPAVEASLLAARRRRAARSEARR